MQGTYTRSFIGLLVVAAAYIAYSLVAVPIIEPQIHLPKQTDPRPAPPPGAASEASPLHGFEHLFTSGDWELDGRKTKILDTENGKLLFRDYRPLADGSIEVKPFSVIFLATSSAKQLQAGSTAREDRRPLVLRAVEGATLKFDRPIRRGQVDIGRFVGGWIRGRVEIYSPATSPNADNALHIETRNVQLDEQRVFTPHDVAFRMGQHWGSGRNLTIHMLRDRSGKEAPISIKGVKSVELVYVDKMHLAATQRGPGRSSSSADQATDSLLPTDSDAPLEITCRGPFLLDAEQMIASFEDHVDVLRIRPDGPSDQLNCQLLEVHFGPPDQRSADPDSVPVQNQNASAVLQRSDVAATAGANRRGPSDPMMSGLDVKRIVAVGYPVTVHADYEVEAKRVQCEIGPNGEIETLWANGSGRIYQVGDDGRTTFSATWGKEFRFQPHEGNHALSLIEEAVVHVPGRADFIADQVHVWISQKKGRNPDGSMAKQAEMMPTKMLATGNIHFESLQVSGQTERMEAWFVDAVELPSTTDSAAGQSASTVPARPQAGSGPATLQQATAPGRSGQPPLFSQSSPGRSEAQSKFDVRGRRMRMELIWDRKEKSITAAKELIVAGDVEARETVMAEPDAAPMKLSGDLLNVLPGPASANSAVATVTGAPAQVEARGMTLAGKQINLDQAANRVWIDSPGRMTLPSDRFAGLVASTSSPSFATRQRFESRTTQQSPGRRSSTGDPSEAIVSWQGRMEFDGRLARFLGQISATTSSVSQNMDRTQSVIRSDVLDVVLTRRVDFVKPKQPRSEEDLLQSVLFNQNVEVESRTHDSLGKLTSVDRLKSRNLRYDARANQVTADGPGWLSSARFGSGVLAEPAQKQQFVSTSIQQKPEELTYSQIDFQHRMVGHTLRREVQFTGKVEAVHGPIDSWQSQLSARVQGGLGEDGVLLRCNSLTAAEMGPPVGGRRNLELRAEGDTYAQGREFQATADRISYDSLKDLIVLDGNGREDARLTQQKSIGGQENRFAARKILYWKSEQRVHVNDARFLDLNDLNSLRGLSSPSDE